MDANQKLGNCRQKFAKSVTDLNFVIIPTEKELFKVTLIALFKLLAKCPVGIFWKCLLHSIKCLKYRFAMYLITVNLAPIIM
jgi:hypothetical protein